MTVFLINTTAVLIHDCINKLLAYIYFINLLIAHDILIIPDLCINTNK